MSPSPIHPEQEIPVPGGVQPKPRSTVKTLAIVAAVVLPLITAAGIAIPLIANLNERESSVDTLNVITPNDPFADAEVIGAIDERSSDDIDWYIPTTAPIETFPLNAPDGVEGCTPQELEWLETHAKIAQHSWAFSVTIHNSSTTGASLPLGNVRFVGEEVESEPFVRFSCPVGGRGATGSGQPLLISVDGTEALYGESLSVSGEDVMPPGSPVTLNLAPGEVSVVTLTRDESVDKQRQYEGRFVADLVDGSGESAVLADEVLFHRDPVEGFYVGFDPGMASNTFVCASPTFSTEFGYNDRPKPRPCSLAEAATVMREATA